MTLWMEQARLSGKLRARQMGSRKPYYYEHLANYHRRQARFYYCFFFGVL